MFSTAGPRAHALRIVVPLVAGVLTLGACSSSTSGSGATGTTGPATAKAATPANVAAVIKGLDNPFFQAMQDGINGAATKDGAKVTIQAATDITDTTGQADRLTTLAGQNFGCYIVNPISGTNLIQALSQVSTAGKPIVNIDNPVDASAAKTAGINIATYIGTNNTAAGGKAGTFLAGTLPAGAKVAVIGGTAGDVTSAARVTGFTSAAAGKLTVVQETAANWNRDLALTAATTIIAAHPDLAGFFVANDDMGLGVVKAIQNAGLTGKILVVSVDGNKDALQSIQSGGLTATVAQYPYAIGSLGLEACEVAVAGGKLPATIESPTALVTSDLAAAAIAAFPQPFTAFADPLTSLLPKK